MFVFRPCIPTVLSVLQKKLDNAASVKLNKMPMAMATEMAQEDPVPAGVEASNNEACFN
jgi:hypothetical protein